MVVLNVGTQLNNFRVKITRVFAERWITDSCLYMDWVQITWITHYNIAFPFLLTSSSILLWGFNIVKSFNWWMFLFKSFKLYSCKLLKFFSKVTSPGMGYLCVLKCQACPASNIQLWLSIEITSEISLSWVTICETKEDQCQSWSL